jgi:hypothetical protein
MAPYLRVLSPNRETVRAPCPTLAAAMNFPMGISCFVLLQLCAQRFYGAVVTRCVLGGQVEDCWNVR